MKARRHKALARRYARTLRIMDKRYSGYHDRGQEYSAPEGRPHKDPVAASLVDAMVAEFDYAFVDMERSMMLDFWGPPIPVNISRPHEHAYWLSRGIVPRLPGEALPYFPTTRRTAS